MEDTLFPKSKKPRRRGAAYTGDAKKKFLAEVYGDSADIEFDDHTGQVKVNGESIYLTSPTRRLSMRHELVADLAATGLKPSQIGRQLATSDNPTGPVSNHYARLLRDPRIRARSQSQVQDVLAVAQQTLKDSVALAAQNIQTAVQRGDVGVSKYVLATQGIIEKKDNPASSGNIHVDFGSWLSNVSNTKEIHEIPSKTIDVTHDVTQLPPPREGERM